MKTMTADGIILAENDAVLRGVLRSVLVHAGQQVFVAADGVEALALARQFRARLVLLDIMMPRLNGLLACEAMRALPGYAAVPIVMLTGYDDAQMRKAAKRFGANDYLTKPFRPDFLLARVARYLGILAETVAAVGVAEGPIPNVRSKVWGDQKQPSAVIRDDSTLGTGRDVMRIYRDAERKQ